MGTRCLTGRTWHPILNRTKDSEMRNQAWDHFMSSLRTLKRNIWVFWPLWSKPKRQVGIKVSKVSFSVMFLYLFFRMKIRALILSCQVETPFRPTRWNFRASYRGDLPNLEFQRRGEGCLAKKPLVQHVAELRWSVGSAKPDISDWVFSFSSDHDGLWPWGDWIHLSWTCRPQTSCW